MYWITHIQYLSVDHTITKDLKAFTIIKILHHYVHDEYEVSREDVNSDTHCSLEPMNGHHTPSTNNSFSSRVRGFSISRHVQY